MDRLIYIAGTGAKAAQHRQDVVANNLANVSTTGFKAQIAAYRTAPGQGGTLPTRAYAVESTTGADLNPGPMLTTDNPMDIAVAGDGWIAVQGADGRESYLRTGTLVPNEQGQLTLHGKLVVGESGPITVPQDQSLVIGRDGTVSAVPANGSRANGTQLGRIKLVTAEPGALSRMADGSFRTGNGQDLDAAPAVQLAAGKLEGSNVNPTETLVQMIAVARQFEMQMRLLQTAQEDGRAAAQLLAPGG